MRYVLYGSVSTRQAAVEWNEEIDTGDQYYPEQEKRQRTPGGTWDSIQCQMTG